MNVKPIPGPWYAIRDGFRITIGNKKTGNTTTPHDYCVAVILDNSYQAEANARLIAAAPELLEVLTQCVAYFDAIDAMQPGKDHGAVGKAVRETARSAIAKATGEKP